MSRTKALATNIQAVSPESIADDNSSKLFATKVQIKTKIDKTIKFNFFPIYRGKKREFGLIKKEKNNFYR